MVTQAASACSYGLSQSQIASVAAGTSGTIGVTTTCPVIASSNQDWVTATPLGSSVGYTIAPNDGAFQRTAILTIGTQAVSITQAGSGGAAPVSVSPATGSAGRQVFTFVTRDLAGANNIIYTQFLFSKSGLSALNACYISYDPTGNVFYLLSDDMTSWYGLLGGSPNTIGNAQCTIHGLTSGSSKTGADLTTNVDVSFRSGFSGSKAIYQFSGDTLGGTSGWQAMGTFKFAQGTIRTRSASKIGQLIQGNSYSQFGVRAFDFNVRGEFASGFMDTTLR